MWYEKTSFKMTSYTPPCITGLHTPVLTFVATHVCPLVGDFRQDENFMCCLFYGMMMIGVFNLASYSIVKTKIPSTQSRNTRRIEFFSYVPHTNKFFIPTSRNPSFRLKICPPPQFFFVLQFLGMTLICYYRMSFGNPIKVDRLEPIVRKHLI